MIQYRIKEYYKIDEYCKKIWLESKKNEHYSNFEHYGLGLAMPAIMLQFDGNPNDEPLWVDNSLFFDTKNDTRCQVYLTTNNNVCVVETNDDGMEDVYRVEFGFPF